MAASASSSAVDGAHKPSPTANTKANRLPAPTLFVGPPSRNASNLSLARPTTQDSNHRPVRDPVARLRAQHSEVEPLSESSRENAPPVPEGIPTLKKATTKDLEARWKDMQATLNEVELTAQSSTHVFGEAHAAALDNLRQAQVELARAWGRGNEERPASDGTGPNTAAGALNTNRFKGANDLALDRASAVRPRGETVASTASTALSDESGLSESIGKGGKTQLEDETAQDVKLASERRAANEAYFKKVDSGVKDVVAKLEKVAEAMRGVESESRSLWSESRSSTSTESREDAPEEGVK